MSVTHSYLPHPERQTPERLQCLVWALHRRDAESAPGALAALWAEADKIAAERRRARADAMTLDWRDTEAGAGARILAIQPAAGPEADWRDLPDDNDFDGGVYQHVR